MALTQVKIFPSIGIARLGNSQEWYPGTAPPLNWKPTGTAAGSSMPAISRA